MKKNILSTVLVFSILFLFSASPVDACLNDRDVEATEREFKSNYETKKPQVQADQAPEARGEKSSNSTIRVVKVGLSGTGLLMLLAGGVLVIQRLRLSDE